MTEATLTIVNPVATPESRRDASQALQVALAESRVRSESNAAENVLHYISVISTFSSDSQAMGLVGENWLPEDAARNDNFRVLRYVAKLMINPAITLSISQTLGSIELAEMADIVLLQPSMLAAKPQLVIEGGLINRSILGAPKASPPTPRPVYYRPMFGTYRRRCGNVRGDVGRGTRHRCPGEGDLDANWS